MANNNSTSNKKEDLFVTKWIMEKIARNKSVSKRRKAAEKLIASLKHETRISSTDLQRHVRI